MSEPLDPPRAKRAASRPATPRGGNGAAHTVGPTAEPADDPLEGSLRPHRLPDFVGQRALKDALEIAMTAARGRNEPLDHVLFYGPPGLGKTTLAHVIAEEMNTRLYVTSGPALGKPSDLVGTLTRMEPHDVLFIDEIHRTPPSIEEFIYPAMEDFKIDFTLDTGMHAKMITINLKPFTLIGATTRAGLLTGALRSRFGITHNLRFYETEELLRILHHAASRLALPDVSEQDLDVIARRSRGTPRIAIRLLRRIRDFAQVRAGGRIDNDVIDQALALEGVDAFGLDDLDRSYLRTIADVYGGGPVGLEAIAATMGQDSGTLEDMVEPYLLQLGLVARSRQGRQLTDQGAATVPSAAKAPPARTCAEPVLFGQVTTP